MSTLIDYFDNTSEKTPGHFALESATRAVTVNSLGKNRDAANYVISTESLKPETAQLLRNSADNFKEVMQTMWASLSESLEAYRGAHLPAGSELHVERKLSNHQIAAGWLASMEAADPLKFFHSTADVRRLTPPGGDISAAIDPIAWNEPGSSMQRYSKSLEAYDEKPNRQVVEFSILWNMLSLQRRPDDFSESWYPTVIFQPNMAGFEVTAQIWEILEPNHRNINGDVMKFQPKNLMRALVDPDSMLKNDTNRLVPVVRQDSVNKFVDSSLVGSWDYSMYGTPIPTAPIKTGVEVDLVGLSTTDAELVNAAPDITDTLDPALWVDRVWVKVVDDSDPQNIKTDVLSLNVRELPRANFMASTQGYNRDMTLNFSETVVISSDIKSVGGVALDALAGIDTFKLNLRIKLGLVGNANTERGSAVVSGNGIRVDYAYDGLNNNSPLALTDNKVAPIKALLESAEVIGWWPDAYKTLSNRSMRGDIIYRREYRQSYLVPLLAPITSLRPVTDNEDEAAKDLNTLVTTTIYRNDAASVRALQSFSTHLAQWKDLRDDINEGPPTLGIGRFYVRPFYDTDTINLDEIGTLQSQDRLENIQAALVSRLRYWALKAWQESEYQIAADFINGAQSAMPIVKIATDPVLANFIMTPGDLRTFGQNLNFHVSYSYNKLMRGKIYLSFGVSDGNSNNSVNPLNFGITAFSPELVTALPIQRDGRTSFERTVQPRWLKINNLPVLVDITVNKLYDAHGLVPIYNKVQP